MATMLNVNSLQPPKTGTSRWSKALPDVPGPDDPAFYDDYDYDDPSPRLPPTQEFSMPPPRSTSMANAKPLPRSLPPLHLLAAADAPPAGPPKMAIPRRPVGKQPPLQPPPPPQMQLGHQQKQQPPPPSPSESLSSILSAYSRSSGESLVRSSDGAITSSDRQSEANPSPSREAPLASTSISTKTGTLISPASAEQHHQQQDQQQYAAPKPPLKASRPPPLPSKDTKYHLPATPAPNRPPKPESNISPIKSSPPRAQQQPQLWRRRSSKAERSLELPDLKLVTSHGSTAATKPTIAVAAPSQSAQQQLPEGVTKFSTLPSQQLGSTNNSALSGQDTRQVPASEQAAESPIMGSNSSKLNRLKDKLHLHRRGKSSSDTSKSSTPRPGAQRPPTPEYQKEDIKTPIVDSFVSPLSPASSPEPAAEVSPELPNDIPQLPPQQRARAPSSASIESKPITRKALPAPKLPSPVEIKPQPEPSAKVESPVIGSLPPLVTDFAGNRGSSGSDSPSNRTQPPADVPTRFPPRHSSVRSNAPPRQLAADQDPRLVQSESQGFLYKGRDGTLYPEMRVLREPDPQAAYFPKQADFPIAEGTVIKAPPLKESHFNCYHGHRTMNRRTNRHYPLTCQGCEASDVEDRWTCTFCHLRICESCLKKLNSNGRDLRRLTEEAKQTS
ncbi:hypothetical protein Neosp_000544 [[Neocosmospora] mangrovei]